MNVEKTNIKLLIVITIIVTTALSTTYAFLNLQDSKTTTATNAGCFVVDYTGQILTSSALTSTTEAEYQQGTHATVTLKKNSECQIYSEATISLYTGSNTAPLNKPRALKYKVLQGTTEKASGVIKNTTIPNEDDETNPVPKDFSIDLLTVPLTTTATKYDIYIWLDKTRSLGEYHGTTYSGHIYATSEQSSTITS